MLSDEAVDLFDNGNQTFHGCGVRAHVKFFNWIFLRLFN
jgi:hypothetical protein